MHNTIFCDIDGTIFEYHDDCLEALVLETLKVKAGAAQEFARLHSLGCRIILVTARPESTRAATEKQLSNGHIIYDQLIMGIGGGVRVLINDSAKKMSPKAIAINVDRRNPKFLDGGKVSFE